MKVHFERSGGFTGISTSVLLDTDNMSQDESAQLHQMCDDMNFFNLPSKLDAKSGAADFFRYKITVESKDKKHTVETTDLSMTPDLENLINYLSGKTQKQ